MYVVNNWIISHLYCFLEYHHLYMGWCALWSTHDCWDAYPSIPEKAGINHWRIFPILGWLKCGWAWIQATFMEHVGNKKEKQVLYIDVFSEIIMNFWTNNSPTVKNDWLVSSFSQYHKSDCQLESSTIGLSDNVGYAWVCHLIWLVVCHLIWMMKFPIWKNNSNVWNHQPPFHIPLPDGYSPWNQH